MQYVFSMDEVLDLENQVEDLHRMCLHAVEHVIEHARYADFAIPEWVAPEIARSWERSDPHLYGRFDLRYDGTGPAKMLEYNADTPQPAGRGVRRAVVLAARTAIPTTTSGTPSTNG